MTRPPNPLPRADALPRIIVHAPAHADAALAAATEAARAIILQSPPRCVLIQGAPWFRKLVEAARARHPNAKALAVVDCADAPGLALGALRDGAEAVRLSGVDDRALATVADMAAQLGARVDDGAAEPLLDLQAEHDPLAACRRFLASGLE